MVITFRKLEDYDYEYEIIYNWCKNKDIYEWFEQRELTFDEIKTKYKNKLEAGKQEILIIRCDNKDIGLVQIYKYDDDLDIKELKKYKNTYEYDIFIGDKEYTSKGIGSLVINLIDDIIYSKYKADSIILRPFKRNVRAVKCYQKCNYKIIDEYEDFDTIGNKEIITVLLNNKNNP